LELGAGIGRFTGLLADRGARSIVAVDFMQKFVDKNRELNGHRANCSFLQADVTQLELPARSYDMIFSNWLLMYLSEEEVFNLFKNLLLWLRPGGYFFFRESCFHQSGNKGRKQNPTQYRHPNVYSSILEAVSIDEPTGCYAFDIILSKSVQTYVQLKSNRNQICWLLHKELKSESETGGYKTFQEFLDQQQYTTNNIRIYEWVFGRDFISPGGLETTEEFVQMLNLQPRQQVLDVGSGIGGSAFLMASKYDVFVNGMDLSGNMVETALERANEIRDQRVQFEIGDATKRQYHPESYDVVFSRDTILHIADKPQLFQSFHRWLKPGGKVLITDYCCGRPRDSWSADFVDYVDQRGYHLVDVDQYGELLKQAGFVRVRVENRTEQFRKILLIELQRLENGKDEFIKEYSAEDYRKLVDGWNRKLRHCSSGDHSWGLFYAEKADK
jgi:phosphoethanolamine N-methyltransferase